MTARTITFNNLTAQQRVELMGELWDSLDPVAAAPMTDAIAAELDRRETEADQDPEAGSSWKDISGELRKKLP